MNYRGVEIQLLETNGAQISDSYGTPVEYTVNRKNGLVYTAKSKYGFSFAQNAPDALEGAKKLIDAQSK